MVSEIPLEASSEDVAEQCADVMSTGPEHDVPAEAPPAAGPVPWDADPADFAEQQAEVPLDDDWA